ncbi:NAD-binding protein [Clostridium subterminale]|uniref:RCK N-terminal domain-containing protein n=1 Tax=Clostridium subterminale TaxID=1550 RepID=A0ABP3VY97_CLOSU
MFVVVISESKFINLYKESLDDLNLDFSNVISPQELSPAFSDIFNNYLLKRADVVVIITPKDQFNFYISKVCKTFYETKKVITLINNSNNKDIFTSIGVLDVIDFNCYAKETLYKFLEKGAV